MAGLFAIFLSAVLVNNYVLSKFLGICSFLGVSKKVETAKGMGLAVTFVMLLASLITTAMNWILISLHTQYLSTLAFILVIAALVQFVEIVIKKTQPALYKALGIFLPLITTNCAVMGVAISNYQANYNLVQAVVNALGSALGYMLAIVLLAGIRERLDENNTMPEAFKGLPIALITAALMSIAFLGFNGLIGDLPTGSKNLAEDGSAIFLPALVMAIIGAFFAFLLVFANSKFKVEEDERIPVVRECLPSANCGGCGFAGCDAYSTAIVEEDADISLCAPGGDLCIKKIAEIMGKVAEKSNPLTAFVKCNGTLDNTKELYEYDGIKKCAEATIMPGKGNKLCEHACIGYGDCVDSCKFGAIDIVDNVAIINDNLCASCGSCVKSCPKDLIVLIPKGSDQRIRCSSTDKGKGVLDSCFTGCTGCTLCSKVCPEGAITMINNLPVFDYDKCNSCGICSSKCPRKSIYSKNGIIKLKQE